MHQVYYAKIKPLRRKDRYELYYRYLPESRKKRVDNYVKEGGMAGSYLYKQDEEKYSYLKDVFNTLIFRDIKQKYKIRNTNYILSMTVYSSDDTCEWDDEKNQINIRKHGISFTLAMM